MASNTPLVDSEYRLEKFPGKGGWTYAAIPEILQNKDNPFGWVKVKGFIDQFELKQFKLMPMGNGQLFLPVKAAIRKAIQKEAGDLVKIILFPDDTPIQIPAEILTCFEYEPPHIKAQFLKFTEGEQKTYLDWIANAKTIETKTKRIAKMINRLDKGLRYHDKA